MLAPAVNGPSATPKRSSRRRSTDPIAWVTVREAADEVGVPVGWFKRLRRKLRNYTAGGDYPGGHGAGSSPSTASSEARLGVEHTRTRDHGPIA